MSREFASFFNLFLESPNAHQGSGGAGLDQICVLLRKIRRQGSHSAGSGGMRDSKQSQIF